MLDDAFEYKFVTHTFYHGRLSRILRKPLHGPAIKAPYKAFRKLHNPSLRIPELFCSVSFIECTLLFADRFSLTLSVTFCSKDIVFTYFYSRYNRDSDGLTQSSGSFELSYITTNI